MTASTAHPSNPERWIDQSYDGESFDERDLSDVGFDRCRFVNCAFRGTRLLDCRTDHCTFVECDFTGAHLGGSTHVSSAFLTCRFALAGLFNVSFQECKLTGSSFEHAKLSSLHIDGGDWSYVDFVRQNLKGHALRGLNLADANLTECNLERADLRDADLSGAMLGQARLKGADLRGANLSRIDLATLNLTGVRLDLDGAIMVARAHGAVVDPEAL